MNLRKALTRLRAARHGAAFAALLAVVLAPFNLCCVGGPAAAIAANFEAVSLYAGAGAAEKIVLCHHEGADGERNPDRTPASSNTDHCPACHLAHSAAIVPPAPAKAAYAQSAAETLAPPDAFAFHAAATILAAQPRGPPILI